MSWDGIPLLSLATGSESHPTNSGSYFSKRCLAMPGGACSNQECWNVRTSQVSRMRPATHGRGGCSGPRVDVETILQPVVSRPRREGGFLPVRGSRADHLLGDLSPHQSGALRR